jgi:hypothetical protein
MYEIWLAMNIAYEIALGLWPALLPLALVWAWSWRSTAKSWRRSAAPLWRLWPCWWRWRRWWLCRLCPMLHCLTWGIGWTGPLCWAWPRVWAWRQRCCCGPCWQCASAERAEVEWNLSKTTVVLFPDGLVAHGLGEIGHAASLCFAARGLAGCAVHGRVVHAAQRRALCNPGCDGHHHR